MDTSPHSLSTLFQQLGLPSDSQSIEAFIDSHRTQDRAAHLEKLPFWNEAQAHFIEEALEEDSDWAEVVDELNTRLHG